MPTNDNQSQTETMYRLLTRLRRGFTPEDLERSPAIDDTFQAFHVTLEELKVVEEQLLETTEILVSTRNELDNERRRYHDLFDLAPEGFLVTDREGVVIEANRAAAHLLNVPQRFMPGKVLAGFVPESARRAFRSWLRDAAGATAPAPWRFPLQPRNRAAVEVEVSMRSAPSSSGRRRELLWLLRVVEEDRRPETEWRPALVSPAAVNRAADRAAVEAERDRLRTLVDSVAAVIYEADPLTGRLTFVSRECETLLGLPAADLLEAADFWAGRVHPDDRAMVASRRARQLTEGNDLEIEYRLTHTDGRAIWVRDVVRYAAGFDGSPAPLRGVLLNISRRKKTERRLYVTKNEAETEARDLRHLQDLCQRLAASVDLPGVLDEIVTAVTAILGSDMGAISLYQPSKGELDVAASVGLLEPLTRDPIWIGETLCTEALADHQSVIVEDTEADGVFAGCREAGQLAGFRAVFHTPLFNLAGEPLGIISVCFAEPHRPPDKQQELVELYTRLAGQSLENARRHQEVRKAEQHNAAIGRELQNPLSAMANALRLLEAPEAGDDTRRAAVEALGRQIRQMTRLVDDVIAGSRIDSDVIRLPEKPTDLAG